MIKMNSALVFSLVLIASIQVLVSGRIFRGSIANHNANWGDRTGGDRLLYTISSELSAKWLRKQSLDVVFPEQGDSQKIVITRIEAIDNKSDGTGGRAYLAYGGVGQDHVMIHLMSQRSKGMNFTVNIYGRNV